MRKAFTVLALCAAAASLGVRVPGSDAAPAWADSQVPPRAESFAQPHESVAHPPLPCDFEVNCGQTTADVDYLARCAGYVAFLTKGGAVIRTGREVFRLHVVDAAAIEPRASLPQPGRSNYFIGSDETSWVTEVPHFGRVAYDGVRPGVELDWRAQDRALAFDVVIARGAEPAVHPVHLDHRPYTATPGVRDGTAPFRWSITSGKLQDGFTAFDINTGVFSGTPTQASRAVITFDATDAAGAAVNRMFAVDPAAAPLTIPFSALPGSKLVVTVNAAKASFAVPTITSVKDAQGTELLVPAELKASKKGAVLRAKTPLAGGDYVVTFAPGAGPAGEIVWSIAAKAPRGYVFDLPDLGITGP